MINQHYLYNYINLYYQYMYLLFRLGYPLLFEVEIQMLFIITYFIICFVFPHMLHLLIYIDCIQILNVRFKRLIFRYSRSIFFLSVYIPFCLYKCRRGDQIVRFVVCFVYHRIHGRKKRIITKQVIQPSYRETQWVYY